MKIVVIGIEKKYIIRLWEPLRLYMGGWVPYVAYTTQRDPLQHITIFPAVVVRK